MIDELSSGIYFIKIYKKESDKMRITKLLKEYMKEDYQDIYLRI